MRLKRDMDLIRDFLLKIEAAQDKLSWKALIPQGTNEAEAQRILEHLKLLERRDWSAAPLCTFRGTVFQLILG